MPLIQSARVGVSGASVASILAIVLSMFAVLTSNPVWSASKPDAFAEQHRALVAHELQIRDDDGRVRMRLSIVDSQPQIRLFTPDGDVTTLLGLHDGVPSLLLANGSRSGLSASKEEAEVNIYRPNPAIEAPAVSLAASDHASELRLRPEQEDRGIALSITPFGYVLLMNAVGAEPDVFLSANPDGPRFLMYDKNHKVIFDPVVAP